MQNIFNPAAIPRLRLGGVHAGDGGIDLSRSDLDTPEDNPQSSFDPFWAYHLKGLPRICSMQGRTFKTAATPEAARVRGLSWKLLLQLISNEVLSTTEVSDTVSRCDAGQPEHESPTYSIERFPAGDFAE